MCCDGWVDEVGEGVDECIGEIDECVCVRGRGVKMMCGAWIVSCFVQWNERR